MSQKSFQFSPKMRVCIQYNIKLRILFRKNIEIFFINLNHALRLVPRYNLLYITIWCVSLNATTYIYNVSSSRWPLMLRLANSKHNTTPRTMYTRMCHNPNKTGKNKNTFQNPCETCVNVYSACDSCHSKQLLAEVEWSWSLNKI